MVVHIAPRHVINRQNTDPFTAPTGFGIESGAALTATDVPTATDLAIDPAATSGISQSAPNLGVTTTPVSTSGPSELPAVGTSTPQPSSSPAVASGSQIPISTVIGACVGAFIGAIGLIVLGLWLYRRYSNSLKHRSRSRRALGAPRNAKGDLGRRRSHLEPWNKLEEGDDKWEGMYQAKEVDNVAPMEKLTMFKKSPSVRTAYTHKSDEPVTFDAHPFAQYNANLAQELATDDKPTELPIARQFLGRVDTGPAISWDGATVGGDSFVTVHSNHTSTNPMSPSLNMAIPTPVAITSQLHRWESAEVIEYEDPSAAESTESRSKNPFESSPERRKSSNNPFFGTTTNYNRTRSNSTRSRSNSVRSRSSTHSRSTSVSTVKADVPKMNKGKERAMDSDPFNDDKLFNNFPRPFATSHAASSSMSSVSSNDRAMQSLIAALDVSEQEVQERLRVASMQPSVMTTTSMYTSGGEDEDVTGSFPLPPSIEGGNHGFR